MGWINIGAIRTCKYKPIVVFFLVIKDKPIDIVVDLFILLLFVF